MREQRSQQGHLVRALALPVSHLPLVKPGPLGGCPTPAVGQRKGPLPAGLRRHPGLCREGLGVRSCMLVRVSSAAERAAMWEEALACLRLGQEGWKTPFSAAAVRRCRAPLQRGTCGAKGQEAHAFVSSGLLSALPLPPCGCTARRPALRFLKHGTDCFGSRNLGQPPPTWALSS